MKTQTIHTSEMTPRPFFPRLAAKATLNPDFHQENRNAGKWRSGFRSAVLCTLILAFTLVTARVNAQSAYEHFNYPQNTQIDGQGTRSNGWAGPWSGGNDLVVTGLPNNM